MAVARKEVKMANEKNQWIILEDENGEKKRYNLASMTRLGISIREDAWATGVSLEEVYLMPRSKKVILETYSIWEDRNTHGCVGTRYHVADPDTIARLADRSGDERLLNLVPVGQDN
jgi:hypothetical protein